MTGRTNAQAGASSSSNLGTKTVSGSGTYTAAADNLDGFSSFTVAIQAFAPVVTVGSDNYAYIENTNGNFCHTIAVYATGVFIGNVYPDSELSLYLPDVTTALIADITAKCFCNGLLDSPLSEAAEYEYTSGDSM